MKYLIAFTIVMALAFPAQADVLQAHAVWANDEVPPASNGNLSIVYDPIGSAENVVFIMESGGNRGVLARDATPIGWIDVQAQFWDLTADGVSGEYFGLGGQYWHLDPFLVADSVRLVNTADDSFVEVNNVRTNIVWSDIAIESEPAEPPAQPAGLVIDAFYLKHPAAKCIDYGNSRPDVTAYTVYSQTRSPSTLLHFRSARRHAYLPWGTPIDDVQRAEGLHQFTALDDNAPLGVKFTSTPGNASLVLDWQESDCRDHFPADKLIKQAVHPPGDANLDGVFDSSDLVEVFQSGLYETGEISGPDFRWPLGDFNGDKAFDSTDLVEAFMAGGYEQSAASAVPEPASRVLLLLGIATAILHLQLRSAQKETGHPCPCSKEKV